MNPFLLSTLLLLLAAARVRGLLSIVMGYSILVIETGLGGFAVDTLIRGLEARCYYLALWCKSCSLMRIEEQECGGRGEYPTQIQQQKKERSEEIKLEQTYPGSTWMR